ncbi:farnesol dehydrogenase-like [Musca vetustissima]|uniref:farnesol dehydrogenase-like n=1 Tax=Musca vetustissima TaxID=27455 RepID=UPI002AB69844|nr:farnesol dehydrogenase-like [Musca vetustissima]
MEQLKWKIAVVTGASSGIGAAVVKDLLKAQLIVIGLARRIERVEQLKQQLTGEQQQRLHAIRCDVTNANEVAEAFKEISLRHGRIYVLVNNAGCLRMGQLCQMPPEQIQEVLQTNIMGVVNCTRNAFASMQQGAAEENSDGKPRGHIILINSILGHNVPVIPGHVPSLNIYPATKYALTAINEIYRQEFRALGTRIKVTSISPGLVDTELITEEQKKICHGIILQPEDVSRAVMFALSSPPHVNVYELIIKPAGDMI